MSGPFGAQSERLSGHSTVFGLPVSRSKWAESGSADQIWVTRLTRKGSDVARNVVTVLTRKALEVDRNVVSAQTGAWTKWDHFDLLGGLAAMIGEVGVQSGVPARR